LNVLSVYFIFTSRRRHTRSKRDWSSDVCASDLTRLQPMGRPNSLDCPTHLKGVMHMGRERAKAKQTKVARQLKYNTPDMDLDSLQRELASQRPGDSRSLDDDDDYGDSYDDYVDEWDDDQDEVDDRR